MNVETTPELILAAAEKFPQAKEALKTLFPEVFEEDELAFPYKSKYPQDNLVIKDGKDILYRLPHDNDVWMKSVIELCLSQSKKRGTFLIAEIHYNNPYLGFRL
jgi:hypothetical protein